AGQTIDASAIARGLFSFGRVAERVEAAYREFFGPVTLQDLPDGPRFIFCATNVQSGALWRFSKPYMGDYRVGRVHAPTLSIAQAVAASSAFPPFLSPTVLTLDPGDVQADPGSDLSTPPYTQNVVLSDGGVYDNLGLEPAWKQCKTLLVSNAGGRFQPEPDPAEDWTRHSIRVAGIVDSQVRALRTRMLLDAYRTGTRNGAYWGIRTDIAKYSVADRLDCPEWKTQELADEETRLAKMPDDLIDRLINWGYAACDAGYRSYVHDDPAAQKPAFPYPASGVG
ncbi:MAG: patatin-like phospholipase family protein, partial [Deltaproteobacteria bacterium]